MSLATQIMDEMKNAMRAKDTIALEALRAIKSVAQSLDPILVLILDMVYFFINSPDLSSIMSFVKLPISCF